MISPGRRCVFVHVPKTGGSSIRRAFARKDSTAIRFDHGTAVEYRKELGKEVYESYFSFGFVRNPFDRMVSLYTQPRGKWDSLTPEHRAALTMPFKVWVKYLLGNFSGKNKLKRKGIYRSQADFLTDGHGKIIVDRVCKFENIEREWRYVRAKLGMAHIGLPWIARSPDRDPYKSYYDRETRNMVMELHGRDCELFGYWF